MFHSKIRPHAQEGKRDRRTIEAFPQATTNSKNESRSSSASDAQPPVKIGTRPRVKNEPQPKAPSKPPSKPRNEPRSISTTRQQITLYDAIAGRASYEGFLTPQKPLRNANRDTTSHSLTPIPADEVLFRLHGAPVRYEEDDIYSADRHLDPRDEAQRLPGSELLKALHAYVSDFYAVSGDGGDWGSLDESALLALGVLVEEAAGGVWSEREGGSEESESESEPDGNALASQKLSAGVKLDPEERPVAKTSAVSGRAYLAISDSGESGSSVRKATKV